MARRAQVRRPIHQELIVVAVDVAKRSFVARPLAGDGRTAKSCRFGCTAEGFEKLLADASTWVKRFAAGGFVVAMEPTGHYGEPLACWLLDRGIPVYSVPPLFTARSKELEDGTRRKTDDKDCLVIGDLCRRGLAKRWRRLKEPFATLRVLVRQREQLVVRRSRVVNRVQRHLDVVFPELRELFRKLVAKTALWVIATVPTPGDVLAMGTERLAEELHRVSRGQLGRPRAEALVSAAKSSVGVRDALAAHRLAVGQLLAELEEILEQLAEVERSMAESLEQVPYASRLLSIPGLQVISVATLLGEAGDLRDYRHARQLLKMLGLDLVEDSSGQRQGHRHISRRGRHYARQVLYMVALKAGQTFLSARRDRLVEVKKKPAKKAAVANMCALVRIAFALVRNDVDFEHGRHEVAEGTPMAA